MANTGKFSQQEQAVLDAIIAASDEQGGGAVNRRQIASAASRGGITDPTKRPSMLSRSEDVDAPFFRSGYSVFDFDDRLMRVLGRLEARKLIFVERQGTAKNSPVVVTPIG